MASASDYRAHAALQPADCLILLPQRLPAAVETSIRPAHYPAECTQSDAFLQPSLRARKGRANSNSFLCCTFRTASSCGTAAEAVFVHVSALERSDISTLGEGQAVVVDVVEGRRGPGSEGVQGCAWSRS